MTLETLTETIGWFFSDPIRLALGIVATIVIGSIKGAFAMRYRG